MAGVYAHFYTVDHHGYIEEDFSGPGVTFSIEESVSGGLTIVTSNGDFFAELNFDGVDASNAVFFESGSYFMTNDVYAAGDTIPGYGAAYLARDTRSYVACFLAGALIATPQGDRPVDGLVLGDLVMTADGAATAIKWIGRQTVATLFGGSDERAPICIEAGALGDNLPARDLKLTADHALLIDGVLVQAGALVNGVTIRRMDQAETGGVYTVFHIETEGHQIILAEGCPAETFVDNMSRKRFDNYAEYEALFGEEAAAMPELNLPRVKSARQLPASVRDLIAVRQAA
jgi:hypothetical protein